MTGAPPDPGHVADDWPVEVTLVRQPDDDTLYVREVGEEPVDGEEARRYVLTQQDGEPSTQGSEAL